MTIAQLYASRFDTLPTCDGQTDGQDGRRNRGTERTAFMRNLRLGAVAKTWKTDVSYSFVF